MSCKYKIIYSLSQTPHKYFQKSRNLETKMNVSALCGILCCCKCHKSSVPLSWNYKSNLYANKRIWLPLIKNPKSNPVIWECWIFGFWKWFPWILCKKTHQEVFLQNNLVLLFRCDIMGLVLGLFVNINSAFNLCHVLISHIYSQKNTLFPV